MTASGAAFIGGVGFATALALAIARAFINFGIFIGTHVLVGGRPKSLNVLGEVGFGLGMLEVEQRVVVVLISVLLGIRGRLGHEMGAGRNVGGRAILVRTDALQG